VNAYLSKEDLCEHLHSIAELPDAIPYVTSYYAKNWGFCISENQKKSLPEGMYHVLIDSDLKPGVLNYGELIIPGMSSDEILISTYVCHPSMANNELSGPVVAIAIAQWLLGWPNRRYTYRIIFVPETIGSIVYLSRNLDYMKKHTIAGFNLTCLGDDRCYSYLASREGNTLPDSVAEYVLSKYFAPSKRYTFLDRGSDERQYCSPLVDLPVVSLMRSKYGTFPEYHTSLDDLELVTPAGLAGSLNYVASCIYLLENNFIYKTTSPCEPQLGKRGLYPEIGTRNTRDQVRSMMNVLAYSDGNRTLLDIAKLIDVDFKECVFIADRLYQSGIIVKC
jgi:aminopeptidase-like protein